MSQSGIKTVVFDTGSQWLRAGFAAEPFPRAVFKSAVGRFRRPGLIDGVPDVYCGQEAILKRGISTLTWPIQEGLIQDWDEMEKLWFHTFYKELLVAPEETNVMQAVPPLMPGDSKEKLAEILFESFMVNSIYLAPSSALVVHASGRTTGLVWENGYSCCYAAPVFEGFTLKHSIISSPLTGVAMTRALQSLMMKIGYSFTTEREIELLEKIKAEVCYVAEDYESELASHMVGGDTKVRFDLPDGQHILLDQERFQCAETLFRPSLQGFSCPSIIDNICKTISSCDVDHRPIFYNNIVTSGGTTNFTGMNKRLLRELTLRIGNQPGYSCTIDPMGTHAVWSGGAMLASLESLRGCWITRQEFEDQGASKVHHRFF